MAVVPSSRQQLSLDNVSEAGFINFFDSLPKKPATTIRFFDRNDFYSVHGQDSLLAAKEVFNSCTVIKNMGEIRKLESVVLSKPNFCVFVRNLLLVKQYRVEVFRNRGKSGNDWILEYKATPGNFRQLEEVIFEDHVILDSNAVMAVKLATHNGQKVLGVAFFESTGRKLGVGQFQDNDNFSNLESLLVQMSPRECLINVNVVDPDTLRLKQIMERSNCCVTERKTKEFDREDILQYFNGLLKTPSKISLSDDELKHGISAMIVLVKYLELLSDQSNLGCFTLETINLQEYMRLDTAVLNALNINVAPGEHQLASVVSILNNCHTHQGQRLLNQWIKQPLMNIQRIGERLDIVEAFLENASLCHSVRKNFMKVFPDLYRVMKKLQKGKGSLMDCVKIYTALQQLPLLIDALDDYNGAHKEVLNEVFLKPLRDLEEDFIKYKEMVETTIDLGHVQNHEFMIKSSFDENLTHLRYEMDEIEDSISSLFHETSSELSLESGKTIKLDVNSQHGYYLRITKKYEKHLRGRKKFIILETRNEGVRFTFEAMQQLSEEYLILKGNYSDVQGTLVQEVINIACGYADPVLVFNDVIAQLDCYTSLSHAASSAPISYVRPNIIPMESGKIVLKDARHPCLEVQADMAFIQNDVTLFRDSDCFQIITGPNMGGKSTYIRMVGVVVLMAQIGSFVPCSSATISIVDCILARVGAGDCQQNGVSTFMSEMLETASILEVATSNSLIIIDELGRGTSTYDGFGLAWAISEYIATKIQCFCMFATHFHELTALADEVGSVSNLHVTALTNKKTFTLLHKVRKGTCDRSFGIHVAELANFPQDVIIMAKDKAMQLEVYNVDKNESCDEPSAKKRRYEVKEGEKIIEEYLKSVKELPSAVNLSWPKLQEELYLLELAVVNHKNIYVEDILLLCR